MKKAEIYQYLTGKGISYEVTEHGAVYNMEDLATMDLPYPDSDAKNLFVRDDKKRNYYLITVKGEKRVNLKEFRKAHGLRNLSFASPDDLMAIMGLIPGAVTPLGLLNAEEKKVIFYLDQELEDSPDRRTSKRQYCNGLDAVEGSDDAVERTWNGSQCGGNMRIILVDDDKKELETLRTCLQDLIGTSLEITEYCSGEEFLAAWEKSKAGSDAKGRNTGEAGTCDLIILDIYMKELTGIDVARKNP